MHLIRRAALLAGIPLAVMTGIGVALSAQGNAADGRSTVAAGVIGAAVAGATTIYRINGWPLWRQSAVHFAVMAATVLPALLLSGWFPVDGPGAVLQVIGIFLTVGTVLWTALFVIIRGFESRAAAKSVSTADRQPAA